MPPTDHSASSHAGNTLECEHAVCSWTEVDEAYLCVINWETGQYSDCTRRQKNMELMDDVESILEQIGQFEPYGGPRMTFESWWVHSQNPFRVKGFGVFVHSFPRCAPPQADPYLSFRVNKSATPSSPRSLTYWKPITGRRNSVEMGRSRSLPAAPMRDGAGNFLSQT